MNKVAYVPAYFKPIGKEVTVKEPTGETTIGFFGGEKDVMRKKREWKQTGWSDCEIDGRRLAEDLDHMIKQLNSDGYEVVSVTPIMSGKYKYEKDWSYESYGGYGWGYGYGFSYTNSLIVTAKAIM